MPILEFKDKDGNPIYAMVCGRGLKSCQWCNRLQAKLCDHKLSREELAGKRYGKASMTCDASMCEVHATSGGKNIDYCPDHKDDTKQEGLFP